MARPSLHQLVGRVLRRSIAALVVTGLFAAALVASQTPELGRDQIILTGSGTASTTNAATAAGTLSIAGNVTGLFPGASVPLILTVTNPQHFGIVVTSISTSVGDAGRSCHDVNLSVSAFSGQLTVPAGGSAQTQVLATMSYTAPDACQGAVFPLGYTGLASKA